MARLWSCGFELNSMLGEGFADAVGSSTALVSTTKRSGTYACQCNPAGGFSQVNYQHRAAATQEDLYIRAYIRVATFPAATTNILGGVNSSTVRGSIKLTNGGVLQLDNGGVQVGSNSAALSLNTWYMIEIRINSTTLASTVLDARLDGVSFASGTVNIVSAPDRITWGGAVTTPTTSDIYFDDFAINDSSGTAQNSWPGAGGIVHLRPDAAGDNAQWATGVGGTANFNRVNEVTPDDATTYNKRIATGTLIDDHNLASSASAGIGASDTITLAAVGLRMGATTTTATNAAGILRIKGQASGTVSESASFGFNVNGWTTNAIAVPKNYVLTAYTNPQTSTAWTTSTLDTMQIGYKNATSATVDIRASTVWALVEYVPVAASKAILLPQRSPMHLLAR